MPTPTSPYSAVTWSAQAPGATEAAAQLATLTQINIDEFLAALGLIGLLPTHPGRRLIEWVCRRPAQHFARRILAYDNLVGAAGLQAGGTWALHHCIRRLEVQGQAHIPRQGALLVVANHPGLYDALALFASLPRDDLRIVAAERPFWQALPHTERHLFYVQQTSSQLKLVRQVAQHLRRQGTLLLFPGGKIEPDPALLPDAAATLDAWSESVDLFARLVPDLTIVPALVSGVLSPAALRHPLTRIRRTEVDRRWLGATLQFIRPADVTVRVSFGPPIVAGNRPGTQADLPSRMVPAAMRRLIAQVPRPEQPR